jgi:hypothetical protein
LKQFTLFSIFSNEPDKRKPGADGHGSRWMNEERKGAAEAAEPTATAEPTVQEEKRNEQLSDEELDQVAGGAGEPQPQGDKYISGF